MINYWERYSSDETWSGATEHARPATKAKAAPRVWPGEGEALIASKADEPPTTVPTATAKPSPTALPTASAPHFFTQQQRDQHESDTEMNEPPHRDITLEGLCRIHKNRRIAKTKLAQRRGSVHGTSPPTTIGEHSGQLRLSRLNNHSRDERISFIEESHTYYLDGSVQFPMSVSSVWSKFFAVFDAENIIETYFDKWATNPGSKYYGTIAEGRHCAISDAEIKIGIATAWHNKGTVSSTLGTHMHRQIELFLNAREFDASTTELTQFKQFIEQWLCPRRWLPFRTEWSIYDDELMIAGQIDSVFKDEHGLLHMIDWKRVEKDMDPHEGECFGRYGSGPCTSLIDNRWSHYAAQQNLYATILADCYDIEISSMWLLQLHESRNSYTIIELPFFRDVARDMLHRCSNASTQPTAKHDDTIEGS
jgi:hypothetical protein